MIFNDYETRLIENRVFFFFKYKRRVFRVLDVRPILIFSKLIPHKFVIKLNMHLNMAYITQSNRWRRRRRKYVAIIPACNLPFDVGGI